MEPLGINDHVGIMSCYLVFAWPPHLILAGIGTIAAMVLFFIRRSLSVSVLKASWLFAFFLFISGLAFNLIWNIAVFDKLYWAYDYAGWECSPFWLIICSEVNAPSQFFHGMTEGSIRCLWVIYAILSWSTAIWATFRMMKKRIVEPATAPYSEPAARSPQG
jgi:hypothetical protein